MHCTKRTLPTRAYRLLLAFGLVAPLVVPLRAQSGAPQSAAPSLAPAAASSKSTQELVNVITVAPVTQPDDAITAPISSEQIRTNAGTYSDIPRFLQVLPGVMFDTDARNTYLVNGGNPIENLYVVDGVEVPNINHISTANTSGGFVSMIDTDAVSSIKLHKMLYSPEYSGSLSSVLEIKTREVERLGLHGDVSVGYAGADIVLERPIGSRGETVTEFRKSIVNYVTNDIGIDGVPKYYSILSKNAFGLGAKDTISTLYLQGVDSLNIRPNLEDFNDPGFVNTDYTGNRATLAATWEHRFAESVSQRLQVSYSRVRSGTVQTDAITGNSPIDTDALLDQPGILRYDLAADSKSWNLHAGALGELHGIDYQIIQPNGFASPYRLDPTPVDPTNVNRQIRPTDHAEYAEITYHTEDGFAVNGGARYQHYGINQTNVVSPQISVKTPSVRNTYLFGGIAKYSQLAPLPILLGIASNQNLLPITDTQMQAGLVKLTSGEDRITLSVYRKRYHDYPVSAEYPTLSLADIVDPFGQPNIYLPFTSAGSGVASGIEAEYASNMGRRAFLQANVSFQRVTHKALDGVSRRANFDMPVLGNLIAGLRLTAKQRLTTRFGYHTGTPYTPFLVALSQTQHRTIYDLTQINTQRGPVYARLDLRYEIDVPIRDRPLEIYVGLDNTLARKNYYQYVIIPNCPVCGPYELTQQGFLGEGGLTYRF